MLLFKWARIHLRLRRIVAEAELEHQLAYGFFGVILFHVHCFKGFGVKVYGWIVDVHHVFRFFPVLLLQHVVELCL